MFLKQSTSVTIILGPFVDSVDGVTAETSLTIAPADVRLSKNGGAFAQKGDSAACSHMENGYYACALNATDTGTLGRLRVAVNESGALPVWRDFLVMPANVWDSLLAADRLQVHVDELTAGIITAAALAGDAITAAKVAADVGAEIAAAVAAPTAGAIADAVWDEALSPHLTAGSTGDALNDAGGAAADPWTATLPGSYAAGQAGWIVGTRLDARVSSISGNSPGAGAVEWRYTLTESGSGAPIADADVWATTDSAGANVVAGGRTNQSGQLTFYLDSGPVYVWRQKSGYNFANPDVEVIP